MLGLDWKALPEWDTKTMEAVRCVQVDEAWLEVQLDRGWLCAYRLVPKDGRPVVAEVRVYPAGSGKEPPGQWRGEWLGGRAHVPHGGVTSRLLRLVRVGQHGKIRGQIFKRMEEWAAKDFPEFLKRLPKAKQKQWAKLTAGKDIDDFYFYTPKQALRDLGLLPHTATRPKRGRKGLPDLEYARAAARYAKALDAGSKQPVLVVSRARRISVDQARDLIYRARRGGMLTPAGGHGRASGYLTPKAKKLLRTGPRRHK